MTADDTRAGEVAAEEVEALRDEVYRLRSMQRDSNALARQMADLSDERDTAIAEAEQARNERQQAENDLSAQVVNLQVELEDTRAERDRLATEAETQHRLRVEAEQHARDADREREGARDALHRNTQTYTRRLAQISDERDHLAAGVRKLADEYLRDYPSGVHHGLMQRLRALLTPADDTETVTYDGFGAPIVRSAQLDVADRLGRRA